MKRILHGACGVLALWLAASCGEKKEARGGDGGPAARPVAKSAPTRADLGMELGGLMESFGQTIVAVSDQASWDQAKTALQQIEARTVAITAELRNLPAPSATERTVSIQAMKLNEEQLEAALGDKSAFMKRLPPEVGRELGEAAGAFSSRMGLAQQALYGNATPR